MMANYEKSFINALYLLDVYREESFKVDGNSWDV